MSPPVPTKLEEYLDEYVGRGHGADLLEFIRDRLAERPDLIEELIPSMILRPKPLTRVDRAKRASKTALTNRQKDAEERYAVIIPILKRCLEKKPDISLRELAKVLDAEKIKPQRSDRWSPASVLTIMRKAGLGEPTST